MVDVEPPVNEALEHPQVRLLIEEALEALADLEMQARRWGVRAPDLDYVLTLADIVHTLYDDYSALPDPEGQVGYALHPEEVVPMRALYEAFDPVLQDIEDIHHHDAHLSDARWSAVVEAAEAALRAMRRSPSIRETH